VDLRRLRFGEWLAGAAGAALIVALFLPWYEGAETASGYQSLTVIDVLLTLLALLALALPVLQATQDSPSKPVSVGILVVVFGALGVLLVLFRLIDAPADEIAVRYGGWVALLATMAITTAGWRSIAAEYARGLPPDLEPELRATPAP
jgi:hypothetical protein